MAGIYVHIPFCKKRCHYCDFYSTVNLDFTEPFVKAIQQEIESQKEFLATDNLSISTIYFGGGTPSLLSIKQLSDILKAIYNNYSIDTNPEITIEANPDDVSVEYFKGLRNLGFNRTSLGIQSFSDEYLLLMNRRHNSVQGLKSIEYAIAAGIDNFSIDLIYGLPGMDLPQWEETLNTAVNLPIKHLSAYHLGIEEYTVFHHWLKKGKIDAIQEDISFKQFEMLNKIASDKGFEHYEISNLSILGYQSKHNSAYWEGIPYLGFGPAAHSYNKQIRKWNIADVKSYIEKVNNVSVYWEEESIGLKESINEFIMTHLRTNVGIDLKKFENLFGNQHYEMVVKKSQPFINSNFAETTDYHLKLNLKGWFISDSIISGLMI